MRADSYVRGRTVGRLLTKQARPARITQTWCDWLWTWASAACLKHPRFPGLSRWDQTLLNNASAKLPFLQKLKTGFEATCAKQFVLATDSWCRPTCLAACSNCHNSSWAKVKCLWPSESTMYPHIISPIVGVSIQFSMFCSIWAVAKHLWTFGCSVTLSPAPVADWRSPRKSWHGRIFSFYWPHESARAIAHPIKKQKKAGAANLHDNPDRNVDMGRFAAAHLILPAPQALNPKPSRSFAAATFLPTFYHKGLQKVFAVSEFRLPEPLNPLNPKLLYPKLLYPKLLYPELLYPKP